MPWYDKTRNCWRGLVRPNGRRGKKLTQRFDTKEDAIRWERRLKSLTADGIQADTTVAELVARFMMHKVKDRKAARTQLDYANLLDLHILSRIGSRRVCELRLQDIENWYAETLADIRKLTGHPGVSTTNKAATLLYGLLKYGIALGLLDKNPVEGLERVSWKPEEPRCYDLAELTRLLSVCKQPYRAMFALGAMAGQPVSCRPSGWL